MANPQFADSDAYPYGECTYWASYRWHELTGNYPPNTWGNAESWASSAQVSGWDVAAVPGVPSIICLQPGIQGAGTLGHVALVESINSDGTVYCSTMNWYAGGGGYGIKSYWTFKAGQEGVSFVSTGSGSSSDTGNQQQQQQQATPSSGSDALSQIGQWVATTAGLPQTAIDAVSKVSPEPFQLIGLVVMGTVGLAILATWLVFNGGF